MPKHSIIIPAYNRFDYLWNTIISCLASSETDLELLINDDASNPESANQFYDRAKKIDSRVRVFRNKENQGVGTRLAELHTLAQGEFIHVIGSDDLMHPKRLEVASDQITRSTTEQTVWCSSAVYLDANYSRVGASQTNTTNSFLKASLFLQPYILHPTVSYYHPEISFHKPYRVGMKAAVDYMFYVDNYTTAPICFCPASLTYLVHSSSGITRNGLSRSLQLSMHDYAMHRLWSKYVQCTLAQISTLRAILVTNEYPTQDISMLSSSSFQQLCYLIDSLEEIASTLMPACHSDSFFHCREINQAVGNDLIVLTHYMKDRVCKAAKDIF